LLAFILRNLGWEIISVSPSRPMENIKINFYFMLFLFITLETSGFLGLNEKTKLSSFYLTVYALEGLTFIFLLSSGVPRLSRSSYVRLPMFGHLIHGVTEKIIISAFFFSSS
jgi:hypothetical protein